MRQQSKAQARPGKPRGRTALPAFPSDRVKEIRLGLGLTQENVAERSGGKLLSHTVSAVEAGRNKATTLDTRQGLAAGLGLTLDELSQFLACTLSVAAASALVRAREPGLPPPVAATG